MTSKANSVIWFSCVETGMDLWGVWDPCPSCLTWCFFVLLFHFLTFLSSFLTSFLLCICHSSFLTSFLPSYLVPVLPYIRPFRFPTLSDFLLSPYLAFILPLSFLPSYLAVLFFHRYFLPTFHLFFLPHTFLPFFKPSFLFMPPSLLTCVCCFYILSS